MTLHIHSTLARSRVNGPGERFVVWVQGCTLACEGCFNPGARTNDGGECVGVAELAQQIIDTGGIEGLTLSGGEPFQQAAACAQLCRLVRDAGLSVFVFTGYTLEELRRQPAAPIHDLLRQVDVLVDGPFVPSRKCDRLWRGSANQRVHFLTGRYRREDFDLGAPAREVELLLDASGAVCVTGFPDEQLDGMLDELPNRHV